MCRAWRDALADPALWARLDLSRDCGIPSRRITEALLRGAVRRARGRLCYLDVSLWLPIQPHELLALLAANAGSLRELRLSQLQYETDAQALLRAAPLLQVLDAKMHCFAEASAARMMRREAPWAPLRLRALKVWCSQAVVLERYCPVARVAAALADATLQPTLSEVQLFGADTARPEVLGALVDAVLARPLRTLHFSYCTPPAAAPLARLLAGNVLTTLHWRCCDSDPPLLDAAGAALVADGLRARHHVT